MKRVVSLLMAAALCAALFLPTASAEGRYSDVSEDAPYAADADYCAEQGLMNGVGGGLFDPDAPTTRAMAVTVLYRMAGTPAVEASGEDFTDVAADAWYADAVAWAVAHGITSGTGGGCFSPDEPATWEQLVTLLWRYAGEPAAPAPETEDAEDASGEQGPAPWAEDAFLWLASVSFTERLWFGDLAAGDAVDRGRFTTTIARFAQMGALGLDSAPCGILVTEDGSFVVTDTAKKYLWRVEDRFREVYAGGVSVLGIYGDPLGGYNDGALEESLFAEPWAIAPFLDGYAVSDAANNVIRLVRGEGVETVNGSTREELTVTELGVAFSRPTGLATDDEGNLYVSDTLNNAVRKITPAGVVSTVAQELNDPTGLCWADGSLYIAETGGNRILKLTGSLLTVVAGSGEPDYIDGDAAEAAFCAPQGVTVDDDGTIYVSDTANAAVRRIRDGVVDTLLSRDWSALELFPVSPMGLAVRDGRLYVCENFSCKILIVDLTEGG